MKDRLAALLAARGDAGADGDLSEQSAAVDVEAQAVSVGQPVQREQRGALAEFLTQCGTLQQMINAMNTDVEKLRAKHNSILYTPDLDMQQTEKQRNEADELSSAIRKNAMQIRSKVKALEAQIRQEQGKIREKEAGEKKADGGEAGKRNSSGDRYRAMSANSEANGLDVDPTNQTAEMRIKVSQYSTLNHQFYDAYLLFNNEQREYSEKCKDRLVKQIRIAKPEADDEQVEQMLDCGDKVFSDNLLKQTVEAKQQLADIEARHTELVNLERSIRELHDMFVDIEVFVAEQGEMIDRIETAVENAAVYVDKGTEELAKAVTYKKAACKKKICIIGIVSAVVVVIIIIVVISVSM